MSLMPEASRADVEYSIGWIEANPALFDKSFSAFASDCISRGWNITSRTRPGFITMIGSPESNPADMA